MRKLIIGAVAATMLLGCGKDSTGPDGGNPNPDPDTYEIIVDETGFTPDVLPATSSDTVYVGDYIKWTVAAGGGEHRIVFVDVPPGVPTDTTKVLTAGLSDSTSFLKSGLYTFRDINTDATGEVTITALP